jgi:hypothetical protein
VRSAFDAVIAGQSEVSKLIFLVCLLLLALKSSDVYVCRERESGWGPSRELTPGRSSTVLKLWWHLLGREALTQLPVRSPPGRP